ALRTSSAALSSLLLCRALAITNPIWTVVSAVGVILPSHTASVASAALRVIANLVGVGVGVAISPLGPSPMPTLIVGLILVVGLCRLLGIDAAARSASVALIIVALRQPGLAKSPEIRIAQVLLGCAIAFTVTLIASGIERTVDKIKGRGQ